MSFDGLYKETEDRLRDLLKIPSDYTVLFFAGGATPAMEAVVWSLADNSISGIQMGAFSRFWCNTLASRVPHTEQNFWCTELIPTQLPDLNASLILLTPNETSTGVQLPDAFLEEIWNGKSENSLVAWDTTSCAGGRVLPADMYDVQLFGLQKCFAAGGGTCALILSPKAVARARQMATKRNIPYFLDLSEALPFAAQKHQTLNTPSTINIWMCNEACKFMQSNGGLLAMEKLCRAHTDYLVNWAENATWCKPLVKDARFRSFTTLTLQITDPQITDTQINDALAQTGLSNLKDGLKKYRTVRTNSLRVSCFPFVDTEGVEEYKKLTAALDEIVRQLKK
jgi:phosphoserine aminotransferase